MFAVILIIKVRTQINKCAYRHINIHYVYNQTLKIFDDFKFK